MHPRKEIHCSRHKYEVADSRKQKALSPIQDQVISIRLVITSFLITQTLYIVGLCNIMI